MPTRQILPILLLLVTCLAFLRFSGGGKPPASPQADSPSSKDGGPQEEDNPPAEPVMGQHLQSPTGGPLWVAKDVDAYWALIRVGSSRGDAEIEKLLANDRAHLVEEGVAVNVEELDGNRTRVHVLSGRFVGITGWVPIGWVVPRPQPPARAESEELTPRVPSPPRPQKPFINIGTVGRLQTSGVGSLSVATDPDAYDLFLDAVIAKDDIGVLELVVAGKLLTVDEGVPIRVIDRALLRTKVRLEGGTFIGRSGWVPTDWVQPDQ